MQRIAKTAVVLCFLAVYLFACIPLKQKPQVARTPKAGTTPEWNQELLDQKIAFLENIIDEKGISEIDGRIASNLLDTYKSIRKVQPGNFGEPEYLDLVARLFKSLCLLDDVYFSDKKGEPRDYSAAISLFAGKREEILNAYLSGDFQGVINRCLRLKAVFGQDALTPEIALLFALSLAKEGMVKDAINVGEVVENELELAPDLIHLRTSMAELQLSQGKREKALSSYEKLTDMLDEQRAILNALGRRISGAEKIRPDIRVLPSQGKPDPNLADHHGWTADQVLQKAGRLAQDRRFSEARKLLLSKRRGISSGPLVEVFDQALKSLDQAEENYIEEKISGIVKRKEMFTTARKLLEEERFEEAISSIDAFTSGQEKSREVSELRDQAIGNLINRERNRAAKIFLAAIKSQDPEKKKEYLESSHEILNALIVKYPLSPLHDKLKSHLERVAEELKKLGVKKGGNTD